jgi:hypothetical protein
MPRLLDVPKPVVGIDDELGGLVDQVGAATLMTAASM